MEFIPIAEQTGLIVRIGEIILEKALNELFTWDKKGMDMKLSINISTKQFKSRFFSDNVKDLIGKYGVDPSKIAFEVTETTAMEDFETSLAILNNLSEFGIKFLIDDFGTGYSSLAYLKRLPIVGVKIDKSFISDLEYDEESRAIVETIILMAHRLNLSVTAEGVERKGQIEILKKFGCNFAQGYIFSKPIPKEQFEKLLQSKQLII